MLSVVLAVAAVWAVESGDVLLVCNTSDDTVSFVDSKTLEILGTTTTGRGPHEVAVTPDGKWAFVANYEGPGNSISLIDVRKMKEVRKISIDPHRQPHGIVVSRDGTKVFATCEGTQTVIELDIKTETITRSVKTDAFVSHMLVLTPDEKKAYVANIMSGSVTAIDFENEKVAAQIETGDGCEGIDITPDGRWVWASNRQAGNVSVIDTETDKVIETVDCPGFPIRVKITPDGKHALVSCATAGEVAVFDVKTRKETARVSTGAAPIGVLITPDGSRAYVANTRANFVTVLNLENLEVEGEIKAGNTPDGLGLATSP
jgi:YVTN family beta-propeller protein